MDFKKYVEENKDQMLEELFELLRIDTVLVEQPSVKDAPFGSNLVKALEYMLSLGDKYGFVTKNIDNVAGHIEYGEGEEVIGVLAHLDVVPTGEGWTNPPFAPTTIDGKIYARGILDDKGACLASLYALKALKDNNIKVNKKIRLIFGTDEETGSRGIKRYLEVEKMPDLGFSPDACFPIIYGEKGILSFDIKSNELSDEIISFKAGDRYNIVPEVASVKLRNNYKEQFNKFLKDNNYRGEYVNDTYIIYGKRAHAMEPENGENAILRMVKFLDSIVNDKFISFINKYLQNSRLCDMNENFKDNEMGDLTMNVATIDTDNKKLGINFRYPINWDKTSFFNHLNQLLVKSNLTYEILSDSNPHYVNKEDELVQKLHKSYIKYTADSSTPLMTIGGGTYARQLKRAVAFGPNLPYREDVCHTVDEYMYIEDLLLSVSIYADALKELGK